MSRLPPLPPGAPPRLPAGDSYRPDPPRNDERFERRENHNLRDREPMYQFSANNDYYRPSPPRNSYRYEGYAPGTAPPPTRHSSSVYRPQYEQDERDRDQGRSRFTFRAEAPPSISAANAELYRPTSPQPRRNNNSQQNNNGYKRGQGRGGQGHGQGQGRGGYRGRQGPRMASDRAFLKTNREPTPELMPGMDDDETGVRFKPIEDVSDSEEAEMDMSGDENSAAEQPKKKTRTVGKAADGDSVPRWSNPDPYTALPPPDESQRKKKDVVKLIRKARVETNSMSAAKIDAADDFISFDFDDEEKDELSERDPFSPERGIGVAGAPKGPRFSHVTNLHNQQLQAASPAAVSTRVTSQQVQPQINQPLQSRTNVQNVQGRVDNQTFQSRSNVQNVQGRTNHENSQVQVASQNIKPRNNNQNVQVQVNNETMRPSKPVNVDTTSDPALGSRKRNIRDEIKAVKAAPVLHKVGKGASKKPVDGTVLKEWQATSSVSSAPWLEIDHSDTANMGLWLHKEIVDFYHYVKPRDFESYIRTKVVENLRSVLKSDKRYEAAEIHTFGSFPAGLYLPTADMDLVLLSDRYMDGGNQTFGKSNSFYWKFGSYIQHQGLAVNNSMEIITGAKVPLVKYIDRLTGLKIDISFENTTGLVANQTFQNWKAQFPAMPVLVTLIKHLLAMRGLNEPVNGGIGGFSVTCLVVSLLQNMPQVQSRTMIPEHHLGEILMEFFDLYGNQFNTKTTAIQLNPPGYLSKGQTGMPYKANNADRLCIIDPNNSANDISGGSGNTAAILQCFSQTYSDLQTRMGELQYVSPAGRRNQSILKCILGGNYTSFKLQREHLAHVYEKLYGPI